MNRFSLLLCLVAGVCSAAEKVQPLISQADRQLVYRTAANGDRVPDFSYAGYRAGNAAIPDVAVRVVVSPAPGDNTARIQAAIDHVSAMAEDQRGAVLLKPGRFEVAGGLRIGASGVVLRGSGIGEKGTLLVASGHDRRTLITIAGKPLVTNGEPVRIADDYVPVHATSIKVSNPGGVKVGDGMLIRRPSSAEWIKQLGMDQIGGGFIQWKPGTRDIIFDRTITAIKGNEIEFDGPITTALDSKIGGATVQAYTAPGRVSESGVENLRCESAFDAKNPKDEAHSWFAITIENARDCWVRQVTMAHFAGSAVSIWDSAKRITIEDCRSLDPISETAGYRRHTFFTNGTQTLFQRCWSENGRHDFAVGNCAAGPIAFVQCEAVNALDDSGPIDSWASGVLFDNVRLDGNGITFGNRWQQQQFAGWSAANCLAWNSTAALIKCEAPPGATNWSVGCWSQFAGNGVWENTDEFARPTSIYYAQLGARLGVDVGKRSDWMMVPNDASSSPTIEQAAALIAASKNPAPKLADWIDRAAERHPISIDSAGAKPFEEVAQLRVKPAPASQAISIKNGWIVANDAVITGGRQPIMWWRGGVRPADLSQNQPCVTRWIPGRYGAGLTDDLSDLTDGMLNRGQIALTHHYGLWYDRRNDDHERVRRMNGDAWPPFFELPFARSGQGTAWDGLSKYDLTKYNPWYWDRLREFATLCDEKGLVLIHEDFFQHNIIEAGAHWASCPWRSANNINDTCFPEPPPYAGDKRIFMAEQFYDVTNPVRREIYRKYIHQCLDNFAGNSNVIQMTSGEYTGPLPFTQFWLDCIAEWQKDTGKKAIVGLSTTKDVQDAILADPARAAVVSVIDINYWWYQNDGEPYAPPGGKNLAPRQFERVIRHKGSSPEQVYRAVREYRERFPDKAVTYSADSAGGTGAAQLIAGGSLPQLRGADPKLLAAIVAMKPVDAGGTWALSDGKDYIVAGNAVPKSLDPAAYDQKRMELGRGQSILWLTHK